MEEIPLLPDAKRNYRLYYLIPLSFVYLYVETGLQIQIYLSVVATVGAVSRHASEEAIFGPNMQEKGELGEIQQIRRVGTLIFKDKLPHEYRATTSAEMVQEGELVSRFWGGIIGVLALFQVALPVLYLVAIYFLYQNLPSFGIAGGILLFSLTALVVYGFISTIYPNAQELDFGQKIDNDFSDVINGFRQNLYGDDVFVSRVSYEPAEAGAVEIECAVEYEWGKALRRDVNRIAYSFCSVVERSSYPISQAKVHLESADDGEITFVIRAEWCKKLLQGEMTSESFAEQIQNTVLSYPPDEREKHS